MRNERKDNMSKTDKDITPQGYLYGSDPKAFHPFWEDEGGTGDVPDITVTASVDANTGTPEVTVNQTGDHGENIDLAFKNLKGEKGDKGETGSQGPMGPQGPKGDDGTSVDPSYIVKEVVIGSIEDLSMGTKELSFSYVTNDSESHSLDTMHIADKQLVLENVQTSEDSAKTSKIGEINLYTIDQEGTPGSQSIGVAAITNADKSISLCPAINKTGTWEYGPAFATIPATDLTGYISNLEIQYKQNTPKDGVEAYDLKWSINGNSLGGGTRIVVPDYTETVKDITAETSTTDSGTTVTLYQQKFGTEKTKITDISIPNSSSRQNTVTINADQHYFFGVCSNMKTIEVNIENGIDMSNMEYGTIGSISATAYNLDGTSTTFTPIFHSAHTRNGGLTLVFVCEGTVLTVGQAFVIFLNGGGRIIFDTSQS